VDACGLRTAEPARHLLAMGTGTVQIVICPTRLGPACGQPGPRVLLQYDDLNGEWDRVGDVSEIAGQGDRIHVRGLA